jgi:tetraacyldisaccharide 4'-kinase
MRAPDFWQRPGVLPSLLAPAGWLYAAGGWLRQRTTSPRTINVPVICIGNAVAGGAGKTPTVLALAEMLADINPHALSRGYGGRLPGPVLVDPATHSAAETGDEPLLLAARLPAWIARDRVAGAAAACAAGAGLVLMDDGFQNPKLAKTISLLVVDSVTGFGNGYCLPAGPLREPADRALARADAVILVGDDGNGGGFTPQTVKPVFRAGIRPAGDTGDFAGKPVVAFAGIGRPQKFFDTLAACGAEIVARHAFADHHPYSEAELASIAAELKDGVLMVTTEKDHVRLPPAWRDRVHGFPVRLVFDDPASVEQFLHARLSANRMAA